MSFINVAYIGCRCGYYVYIATSSINSGMNFHAKIPLVSLLGLVHFRITFAFFILRRAWSIDDGSIHNGSTMHNHPLLFQTALHVLKELFPYVMFFQQMAEFQKGSSIRNLFTGKVEVHERPHGIAVIDCIFDSSIREVKPVLHKVHTEHGFNASYGASTLTRGIIGGNNIDPVIPGNHLIHGCKEFFALGYLFSMHVLYVSEV